MTFTAKIWSNAAASGDIGGERARGSVGAKTAAGRITVGEAHGSVVAETGGGSISVGIPDGTAAWVDARSLLGRVRNELAETSGPGQSEHSVEVRARTAIGDIAIVRAQHEPATT